MRAIRRREILNDAVRGIGFPYQNPSHNDSPICGVGVAGL